MKNKLPLISVIIPSYNCATTIETAIMSMIEQTYKNLEIIIVDDNSTDETQKIVTGLTKKFNNIFYYKIDEVDNLRVNKRGRNINAGWRARNYGFEKTKGEWIVFQDADDGSLLNRIEVMYSYALKFKSSHVCAQWLQFDEKLVGRSLDVPTIERDHSDIVIPSSKILEIAGDAKGLIPMLLGPLHQFIPFEIKRAWIINRFFFGTLDSYPGTAHSLIKREVMQRVKWFPLQKRIWPSFTGRGADRDFNFRVATTFRNSICLNLPLYLWRVDRQNLDYGNYTKYLID